MSQVEISEAQVDLLGILERVKSGEEVVIAEAGRGVAKLVPIPAGKGRIVKLGRLDGRYKIPDDFDAPLPDDILDMFEGKA